MKPVLSQPWNISTEQALELQRELADAVIQKDAFSPINLVAGVDVAYEKDGDKLFAAVVILNADSLDVVEIATAEDVAQFPYIPGLFSFRELPSLIKAFAKLEHTPDLIVCDGQGIAHPRRFGLACHLGVLFDVPAIGCGKTRLLGEMGELGTERGATTPLVDENEVIGMALRTQDSINPVYVSVGHRVSLETACEWILKLSSKYRLPETTRVADQVVKALMSDKALNIQ